MTTSQAQYSSPTKESKVLVALHYAKLGLPILPMRGVRETNGTVKKNTYPRVGGMDAATTDVKIIEKDWVLYWVQAETLIAVRIDEHFVALDIDCHEGKPDGRTACPDWASLSPFSYNTINGGGRALFRYEPDLRHYAFKDAIGKETGVELLVGRGLCIMPSQLEDWIGQPLTSLADLPPLPSEWRAAPRPKPNGSSQEEDYGESPEVCATRAIYALGCIPNDGSTTELDYRPEWLKIGQSLYAGVCDVGPGFEYLIDRARDAFIEWSLQWPGSRPKHGSARLQSEAGKTFDSFHHSPPHSITVATLFRYANEADPGWREEFNKWFDWLHGTLHRYENCWEDIYARTITDGDGVVHKMGDGQPFPNEYGRPTESEIIEFMQLTGQTPDEELDCASSEFLGQRAASFKGGSGSSGC